MKRFMKRFRYGEKGFTLIELLVVVAILGILAAVIVPNVGTFIGRGAEEAANTELRNVQTAVLAYMVENDGALPTATDDAGEITSVIDTYLVGGIDDVGYPTYSVLADGEVTRTTPP